MAEEVAKNIQDKNLYKRRYAICALGYIGNQDSIPVLKAILEDPTEKDYFRGDALEAIYIIDQAYGTKEGEEVLARLPATEKDFLWRTAEKIVKRPETISLKWQENYGPSGIRIP